MNSNRDWFNFQEDIAQHFRSLGVNAVTNKTIQGVRTEHNVDIYVTSKYLGTNIKWIVEAKHWQTKIPKEKVLALRTIVDDIGADKGFIISQVGFQSGAIEAIKNTNIQLYTFDELILSTKSYVQNEVLETYIRRARLLKIRYFAHKKRIRKDYGLRGELGEVASFSGAWLVSTIFEILDKAKNNLYPIDLTTNMIEKVGSDIAENFIELVQWLNLNLNWLDEKILQAEYQMMKDGVFNPELVNPNLDVQTMEEQFMNMKNFSKNGYSQIIENFLKRRLNK
ncbi:restriction endonuclease [Acinetobacter sp. ANC 5380]|uniref:Restriction endonuclease n=1 Tax=Acinetobacter terrae TaxID=2731247 RepID=A0A7Y2RFF4_9GAMM|nr:restriction endonuclease [Acinetobacter terrae]NNH77654.1 restriction endonuclease [Acinetobacter terrae]